MSQHKIENPSRRPLYLAVLLAFAGTAAAQQAEPETAATEDAAKTEQPVAAAAADEKAKVLDTVKVTAQGREQELKDVPISLQVVDSALIEQLAATDMGDLDGFVPGLEIEDGSPTQPRYAIRGISTGDFGVGTDSAVGVFIDGVYAARSGGAMMAFNDVERVEVLKGPQGTLFGRNTAAGAISIITNKPSRNEEGRLTARFGNDGQQYLYALYNTPVSESSAMRMSVVSNSSDGWLKDAATGEDLNPQENWATKIAWRTNFADGTILDLSWDHEQVDQLARPAIGIVPLGPYPYAPPVPTDPTTYLDPLKAPIYNDVIDNNESRNFDGVTLQLYHSYDWASVTFSAAYRDFDTNNREDEDGTNRSNLYFDTANIESNSSFYTELKFNGVSGNVDWVAGASWYTESADQTSDTHLNTDSINTLYNNLGGFPLYSILQATLDGYGIPFDVIGNPWEEAMVNTGDFTALAVFGDAIWHVTDKLNLTFGLRYTDDRKEFSWYNGAHTADELNKTLTSLAAIGFLPVYYAGLDEMGQYLGLPPGYLPSLYTKDIVWDYSAYGIEGQTVKAKNSWSNWSPRFVIDYAISDDMMIWGSYTQGYKAGGYNSVEINSKFNNEDVDNYEIGLKADFPEQRLGINTSLFSYVYNNKQSIFLDPNTSSGVPQYLTSTSDIEAWGWDLQLYWNPIDSLSFSLNSQYIDQSYKDFVNSSGTDLSGQATGLPKWSTSVGGSYTWDLRDNSSLEFSLMYAYLGAVTCNADSQAQGTCQITANFNQGEATNRTDARLQWTSAEGRWGLGVYGKNVFDNQYVHGINNITASVLGTPFASISDPVQYGIEGQLNF